MACCSGVPKKFFMLNCFFSKLAGLGLQAGWKLRILSGLLSPEAVLSGWPHLWFSCCLVFENLLSSFLQNCPALKLLLQATLETSRNQKQMSKIKKTIDNSKTTIQNQKKHREIERFYPKPKETSRNRKKHPKNQSGQQNIYIIPAHCPRIFFFVLFFFDFSRFFLLLNKIFRFLDVFFGFGQEPNICKGGGGGGGKVENYLQDINTLSQNPFFSSVLARMQQN